MADKMSQLLSRQLPRGGIPTKAPTYFPLDYIENLQRILGKSMKSILPLILKMIIKTYCPLLARQAPVHPQQQEISSCSQEKQLEPSLQVQPDDMTGKHRDREHNPLERPKYSEEEDKVVADGTSHAGQENAFFQAVVGKAETPQATASHFVKLPFERQQREVTTRSTERGADYPIQAGFGGTRK